MTDDDIVRDPNDVCAARAADPVWQQAQADKRAAASARFIQRRIDIGLPLEKKQAGERF